MINKRRILMYCGVIAILGLCASAVTAAEIQLAGIKLNSSVSVVLQRYGNPKEVRVGAGAAASAAAMPGGMPGMMPGAMPGMPGKMDMPGMMPGGMPGKMPPMPGMMPGGMPGKMPPMPGGMPGMPGGMPGMPGKMDMPGMPGMGQATSAPAGPPEVTWVYKFAGNRTLEFLINPEGRVVQISILGTTWPGMRTSRGIALGNLYKDVVVKYGFPESHEQQGIQLLAKYPDKSRVIFTMVGRTVVGITIAL